MKIVGLVFLFLFFIIGVVFWNAYAISYFWNTVFVPLLNTPEMPIIVAIAVASFVAHLTKTIEYEEEELPVQDRVQKIAILLIKPGALILVGWILSKFI